MMKRSFSSMRRGSKVPATGGQVCSGTRAHIHSPLRSTDQAERSGNVTPVLHSQGINDEALFKLRPYQQEMVELSMRRNIIVAMDTGSGKTHIAITRAQATLETCERNKIVWILAPTVALCRQHLVTFQHNLPAFSTRVLTGQDGVDTWSSQLIWDAALLNIRIVISTHAILRDALTHGFVKMSQIALLVFDEAHHCTKEHPARHIMSTFYLPFLVDRTGTTLPTILGLSASPVKSASLKDMESLEESLNSSIVAPKTHRSELLKVVHRPQLAKIVYSDSSGTVQPSILQSLASLYLNYDISRDPYVLSLEETEDPQLAKILINRKTYCHEQLKRFYSQAAKIFQELGAAATETYIIACVDRLLSLSDAESHQMLNFEPKEKLHLAEIMQPLNQDFSRPGEMAQLDSTIVDSDEGHSPKLRELVAVLKTEWTPTFTGIVFVKERAVVSALVQILSSDPSLAAQFRIKGFVGMSAHAQRKKNIAELADPKSQDNTLEEFRSGHLNLLVATNVLEEGIDVPNCHLVICFDKPSNVRSYIQRRGRARREDSKYVLMLADGDVSSGQHDWAQLEADMESAYLKDSQGVLEAQQHEMQTEHVQRVFKTPLLAILTLESAIPALYHFCATLSTGPFIDLRPEFEFEEEAGSGRITATVTLPASVPPSIRTARSSSAYLTERVARRDAAFEAYVALYKAGLVNDNLMPKIKMPDSGIPAKVPMVFAQCRINPWIAVATASDRNKNVWYRARITITSKSESISLTMCSPKLIPITSQFSLYWDKEVKYQVDMELLSSCVYTPEELLAAQQITRKLYLAGHLSRLDATTNDFVVYFLPEIDVQTSFRLNPWTSLQKDVYSAADVDRIQTNGGLMDVGVVSYLGRRHFFKTFDEAQVVVTNIPKRRDFLHEIPDSAAVGISSKTTILPTDACTFGNVPLRYCIASFLVPPILRRLELRMVAEELQSTILKTLEINVSDIQTAISHTSAREAENYQRFEFLGDCIFKYSTSLQLVAKYPEWPEGYLAQAKDARVCNPALEMRSRELGLDKFIVADIFTGAKWRPYYVQEILAKNNTPQAQVERPGKMLADVVESLIGAAYESGGLVKACQCIHLLFPTEDWLSTKDALASICNAACSDEINLQGLERIVGYEFGNRKLLLEAMTHGSFQSVQRATARTYEVLEFLGDSLLDFLVVRRLWRHSTSLSHLMMHRIRTAIVNSWILGFLCMEYGVQEQFNDIVAAEDGSLSPNPYFEQKHLWQYMRYTSPDITLVQKETVKKYAEMREHILAQLHSRSKYPWSALTQFNPAKFYSDLVESVIGAIYVDSKGDFEQCDDFLGRLGLWQILDRILAEDVDCLHPKERIGQLAVTDKVEYVKRWEDGKWKCQIKVGGVEVGGEVEGYLAVDVENEAARRAVPIMEKELEKRKEVERLVVRVDHNQTA